MKIISFSGVKIGRNSPKGRQKQPVRLGNLLGEQVKGLVVCVCTRGSYGLIDPT